MCIGSPLRANEQGAATTLGTCEFNQAVLIGQRTTRKLEAVGQIDAKRPKPRKCIQPCPHSSPRRPYRANVRVADDSLGAVSLAVGSSHLPCVRIRNLAAIPALTAFPTSARSRWRQIAELCGWPAVGQGIDLDRAPGQARSDVSRRAAFG